MKLTPLFALALMLLPACRGGGGGGEGGHAAPTLTAARSLHYRNPATPADPFYLEADPAAGSGDRLVLRLMGRRGLAARGAAFALKVDPSRAQWCEPGPDGGLVRNGEVWNPGAQPPVLMRAKAAAGVLTFGIFERDGAPAVLGDRALATLALRLAPGARPGPVHVSVQGGPDAAVWLDAERKVQPATLAIGHLEAR